MSTKFSVGMVVIKGSDAAAGNDSNGDDSADGLIVTTMSVMVVAVWRW